jgi:hypothetical protein
MARARAARKCAWLTSTGAPFTRLVVNMPAATAGAVEAIIARSFLPSFLTPQ